ncbi:MAG: zinc ribbon domain-containing protein [Desulfobacterales bacterium]|nr:zinc ribbon domain-containing protein [Desulfobacterales bacterium]
MGMIDCPRCGQEISDQAKSCPHYGFSVAVARAGHYLEGFQKLHPKVYRALKYLFIVVIFGVVFWLLTRR